MNEAYKVAVLGDKDSVTAFKALGLTTVVCDTPHEAAIAIRHIVGGDVKYAVIYITEQLASQIPDVVAQYKEAPTPALIMIPSKSGSLGLGLRALSDAAERATGTKLF